MPTAASLATAQNLYVRYYGRPADPAGLTYWATQIDAAGTDIDGVLASFANSAESQALYGSSNLAGCILAAYQNMFGRQPEAQELNWWEAEFVSVPLTFVNLVQAIANGASGTDATTLANKEAAATLFTSDINSYGGGTWYTGSTVIANARAWLATVTTVAQSGVAVGAAVLTQYHQAGGV